MSSLTISSLKQVDDATIVGGDAGDDARGERGAQGFIGSSEGHTS